MARRFRDLAGLSFLLTSELEALQHAQDGALGGLQELRGECADAPPDLVEQAAHCGRWVLVRLLRVIHDISNTNHFCAVFQRICNAFDAMLYRDTYLDVLLEVTACTTVRSARGVG